MVHGGRLRRMSEFTTVLVGASIRIAMLIAIAWVVLALLKRVSAATRHTLWVVTLFAAALMPVTAKLAPAWKMPETIPILAARVDFPKPTTSPAIKNAGSSRAITVTT